jgi:hypothetical protein
MRITTIICLAFALRLGLAGGAHAAGEFAFVTTTDFSTGSASVIDLATRAVQLDVASIHSDAVARYYGGLIYVVNRTPADNIQILDPQNGFATVRQFSTGNGSNPHDIVVVSPTMAYVTRYDTAVLWKMNPATGTMTGSISLATLADADGIPEMDQMGRIGNRLFVGVQRLDRANFYQPTGASYLAVIDITTDTLVDTDPGTSGTQPITLPAANPFSEVWLDLFSGTLTVACVGFFGLQDGGLARVDPYALAPAGVGFSETAAGGDVLDAVIVSPTLGFAIVSTPSFVTNLVTFDPQTGVKLATIYAPGDYVLNDVESAPTGEIYLADRTPTNPGLRVYDGATAALVAGPIDVGLPPFDICMSVPVQTAVADATPRAAAVLGPNYPNPFNPATTIPFTLPVPGRARLTVYGVTGRRVRVLVDSSLDAGDHEARWDGRDDAGRSVASGVYVIRLEAGGTVQSRTAVLLK